MSGRYKDRVHYSSSKSTHHSHKSKSEKRPRESTQRDAGRTPVSGTFLFAVTDHYISDDARFRISDRWGNVLPPKEPTAYDHQQECSGKVWRYRNNIIEEADGYMWMRDSDGNMGIYFASHSGVSFVAPMMKYCTYSVFNCGPFLPCIYALDDCSVANADDELIWVQLAFVSQQASASESPRVQSRIGMDQRHLDVKRPSWVPDIVPESHRTPTREDAPVSEGLGGWVGVILGMIALTQPQGRANRAFEKWRGGPWPGDIRSRRAEPNPAGPPRGVLVHVCLDDDPNSTAESIAYFETAGIMVPSND